MKTYENKEELLKVMLDMDVHEIPDIRLYCQSL